MMTLTNHDIWAIARAGAGQSYSDAPITDWLRGMLDNAGPHDHQNLLRMLGPEVSSRVLATDPASGPPLNDAVARLACPDNVMDEVPDLPKACRLTPEQERQAQEVGQWERDYVAWAGATMNQTPLAFHQGAALFLLSVAIGRRLYMATPWQAKVFPNQYMLITGITTYHHKSTALSAAIDILDEAMPHMRMARPGSPENFMTALAGQWETDNMTPQDKQRMDKAKLYAGQRAIVRDELSGFFRSMGKDYMAGMKEYLLEMYDSPNWIAMSSNSKGIIIAHDISPNVIGASTPRALGSALGDLDWLDGTLARFALIMAEEDYKDRPDPKHTVTPEHFITSLRNLHEKLPAPVPAGMDKWQSPEKWALVTKVWDEIRAYRDGLRDMTAPGSRLDDRLRGIYGRQHIKAMKIAISLAAADWSLASKRGPQPIITLPYWYRALQIAEQWRVNAHRFLHDIQDSEYEQSENRVKNLLQKFPDITRSQLLKRTKLPSHQLDETLNVMIESGELSISMQQTGGRSAKRYRLS